MELLYDVFYNRLRENFIKMNENSRNSSGCNSSNSSNCYNNYLLQYENYTNSLNIYLNNDYGNELINIVSVDRDIERDYDSNNNNKIVINNNKPINDGDDNNCSDEKVQISLWQPWKLSNNNIGMTTKDTKLTSKELPTTKWRRDRRQRTSPDYHHESSQSSQLQQPSQPTTPTSLPFANCLRLSTSAFDVDTAPLDMSLTMKPRSPPPPYRAPLPGSIYASCINSSINRNNITNNGNNTNLNHSSSSSSSSSSNSSSDSVSPRPSVITQAPKRDAKGIKCEKDSISMCDPVIDEHFRRSLGDNYMILFSQNEQSYKKQKPNELDDAQPNMENSKIKSETTSDDDVEDEDDENEDDIDEDGVNHLQNVKRNLKEFQHNPSAVPTLSSPEPEATGLSLSNGNTNTNNLSNKAAPLVRTVALSPKIVNDNSSNKNSINSNKQTSTTTTISNDSIELSVDDHFAKALGETWKKLQESNSSNKKDTLRSCVN